MPYKVEWHIPDRVIYARCYEDYTLDELVAMSQSIAVHYLSTAKSKVHVIADLESMASHPTQVIRIKEATQDWLKHEKMGWLLVSGVNNPMLSFIVNVVTQMIGTKVRQIKNFDEAITTLQKLDHSLVRD